MEEWLQANTGKRIAEARVGYHQPGMHVIQMNGGEFSVPHILTLSVDADDSVSYVVEYCTFDNVKFELSQGSPAIDAGTAKYAEVLKIPDGAYNGSAPDLSAKELAKHP